MVGALPGNDEKEKPINLPSDSAAAHREGSEQSGATRRGRHLSIRRQGAPAPGSCHLFFHCLVRKVCARQGAERLAASRDRLITIEQIVDQMGMPRQIDKGRADFTAAGDKMGRDKMKGGHAVPFRQCRASARRGWAERRANYSGFIEQRGTKTPFQPSCGRNGPRVWGSMSQICSNRMTRGRLPATFLVLVRKAPPSCGEVRQPGLYGGAHQTGVQARRDCRQKGREGEAGGGAARTGRAGTRPMP